MTKFPNLPNCPMGAVDKNGAEHQNLHHPERSEANNLFIPSGPIRAQSKDLASIPSDYRSETSSLRAWQARHSRAMSSFSASMAADWPPRSFDSGSVKPFGKPPVLLAFAQDDGNFEPTLSIRAPYELNLKPV